MPEFLTSFFSAKILRKIFFWSILIILPVKYLWKIFERKGKKLVKRSVGSKFFLLLLQRGVGWGCVGVSDCVIGLLVCDMFI